METTNTTQHLQRCFNLLQRQNRDLYGQICQVIDASDIDSLSFCSNFVKQNRPLIIRNAVNHWPALHLWTSNEYLANEMGDDSLVSVAASPTGRVDAVYQNKYFVEPEVRKMTLRHFFEQLNDAQRDEILYVQQQNGNLNLEFAQLKKDIDVQSLAWMSTAFQTPVDAANIWIGTQESVSSAHKDHYENLYVQICGRKVFYLLPPAAVTHLNIRMYSSAQFEKRGNEWHIQENESGMQVPWIEMDLRRVYEESITLDNATCSSSSSEIYPMKVVLEPGDILYLPSLWYHQVEQENDDLGRVIAVNFWFDMQYDHNYNYYQLLENLSCEWKYPMVNLELDAANNDDEEDDTM